MRIKLTWCVAFYEYHLLALICFALITLSICDVTGLNVLSAQPEKNQIDTPIQPVSVIDYQRQIKPILAKHCYSCHGTATQEAGLGLVKRESALQKLASGKQAIVVGQPEESELIARISSGDESVQMPPEGDRLKPAEIKLLTEWIKAGVEWKDHWSFQPMKRPGVPIVKNQAWVHNEIDAFVLHKLEAAKLQPGSPATPRELVRRVYYDLLGLPPTNAEMEAALAEPWPQAYEKLIDRLLQSPHYGERWARHWLDVVRYAESNSFERDNPKPHAWRYRDYVINSFNADKPYDRFIKEQLAGDELPNANGETLVATGFYRLGVWDDEPADPELAKFDGYDDLVTTTSQAFLGLTVNCARCHDHKIDPISQKDYYSMVSFFRGIKPMQTQGDNIEEPFFETEVDRNAYLEKLEAVRLKRNHIQQQITEIETLFQSIMANQLKTKVDLQDLANLKYRFYRNTWEKLPDFDQLKAETEGDLPDQLIDISLATREDDFGFVFEGELIVPQTGEYKFTLDSDDGSRLTIKGEQILELDGIHGMGDPQSKTMTLEAGRVPLRLDYFQGHFGKGLLLSWSGPGFNSRMLSALPIKMKQNGKLPSINELIMQLGQEALGRLTFDKYKQLKRELNDTNENAIDVQRALCIKEQAGSVPDTFVLQRGSPHAPADKVEPAFISILGGGIPTELKAQEHYPGLKTSGRRIHLANWIASSDNFLTSRVMVNRIWQHHFGRGIVKSPNNFGQLGEAPTHPELLDWLATEFVRQGWSIKKMHKLMLMSNTYQLSAKGVEEHLSKDPGNDLFWRFNLRRLEAEEIRDSVLYVAGNFNPAMYGEPIYPELSADVLATQSQPGRNWKKSTTEALGRRSIYIHVKRSLIVPMLSTFDFPDTDTSCDARFTTTLPSQSLTMINSELMHQQARVLASDVNRQHQETQQMINTIYQRIFQREPQPLESTRALAILQDYQSEHQLSNQEAIACYCLLLLNTNEFLYID